MDSYVVSQEIKRFNLVVSKVDDRFMRLLQDVRLSLVCLYKTTKEIRVVILCLPVNI